MTRPAPDPQPPAGLADCLADIYSHVLQRRRLTAALAAAARRAAQHETPPPATAYQVDAEGGAAESQPLLEVNPHDKVYHLQTE